MTWVVAILWMACASEPVAGEKVTPLPTVAESDAPDPSLCASPPLQEALSLCLVIDAEPTKGAQALTALSDSLDACERADPLVQLCSTEEVRTQAASAKAVHEERLAAAWAGARADVLALGGECNAASVAANGKALELNDAQRYGTIEELAVVTEALEGFESTRDRMLEDLEAYKSAGDTALKTLARDEVARCTATPRTLVAPSKNAAREAEIRAAVKALAALKKSNKGSTPVTSSSKSATTKTTTTKSPQAQQLVEVPGFYYPDGSFEPLGRPLAENEYWGPNITKPAPPSKQKK
jgi:hypothetical protein